MILSLAIASAAVNYYNSKKRQALVQQAEDLETQHQETDENNTFRQGSIDEPDTPLDSKAQEDAEAWRQTEVLTDASECSVPIESTTTTREALEKIEKEKENNKNLQERLQTLMQANASAILELHAKVDHMLLELTQLVRQNNKLLEAAEREKDPIAQLEDANSNKRATSSRFLHHDCRASEGDGAETRARTSETEKEPLAS